MPLTRRNANEAAPPGDAGEPFVAKIDVAWDDVAEPSSETLRPPAEPGAEAADIDPHDLVDGAAALRSARTAASMGRAPPATATAKISAFDLSQALARLTKKDAG